MALIAAHNEAAGIAHAIGSLQAQSWPPDDIVVVADNCTDPTGGLSLLHGASVFQTAGNAAGKALPGTPPELNDRSIRASPARPQTRRSIRVAGLAVVIYRFAAALHQPVG